MVSSGGVAAAFGFRYQYVVTVGLILDLYENPELMSWFVDVDLEGQDSADILVSRKGASWDEAVQVKASQAGSSTVMGASDVRRIFDSLSDEHPTVSDRHLVTNRKLTQDLARDNDNELWSCKPGEYFRHDSRDLGTLIRLLLERISRLRERGAGGLQVHHIILAQLIDMVHQRGSDRSQQRITRADVDRILTEPSALLADAIQKRSWGRAIQVPHSTPIARPELDSFICSKLPLKTLQTGYVYCAVVSGLSGTGKSSSVVKLVQDRIENFAFVLWMDASSEIALQAQLPMVLKELGASDGGGAPAEVFTAVMSQVPVPWLLVLDNAADTESVARWVPCSGYGHVVITSTNKSWSDNFAASTTIQGFSIEEARSFFAARFDKLTLKWSKEQEQACDELARRLEYWPLALEFATAWIKQRGGDIERISDFVDRLDRLNLDDVSLVPHGYPATAYRVVMDLLRDLTENENTLIIGIALMGGHRIPVPLLDSWIATLGSTRELLDGLMHRSVVTMSLHPDQRGPHDYDEFVDMHDAVQLILTRSSDGIPIQGRALIALVDACSDRIKDLIKEQRFIEAATLLPPIDILLSRCVSSFPTAHIPGEWTTLMHNVGTIAVALDGMGPDPNWVRNIGRRWLEVAIEIRKQIANDIAPVSVAALQIETIGVLAYFLDLLHEDGELLLLSRLAVDYGESHGEALNQIGTGVPWALRMIREAVENRHPADRKLHERLHSLEIETSQGQWKHQNPSPLIEKLQLDMLEALSMAQRDHFQEGVNLILKTTELTFSKGILFAKSIEFLLDIGAALIIAVVQRSADNQHLRQLIIQIVDGASSFDDSLTPSQRARMNILKAVGVRKTDDLRQAIIQALQVVDNNHELLDLWTYTAEIIANQYARQDQFINSPKGFTVFNSSDELLYYEAIDQIHNTPILFICNPCFYMIDNAGLHPLGHAPFVESGLTVTANPIAVRPIAHGWYLTLLHDYLEIYSPGGQPLVQQICVSPEFTDLIRKANGVLLVYHDYTKPFDETLTAPAGWISFPQNPATSGCRRRGWRRLFSWLTRDKIRT